jgi:hypothetical protein
MVGPWGASDVTGKVRGESLLPVMSLWLRATVNSVSFRDLTTLVVWTCALLVGSRARFLPRIPHQYSTHNFVRSDSAAQLSQKKPTSTLTMADEEVCVARLLLLRKH